MSTGKSLQKILIILIKILIILYGCRCYVRLDLIWQYKSDLVWRLEGLAFEKKVILYIYIYIERERERERERDREREREKKGRER